MGDTTTNSEDAALEKDLTLETGSFFVEISHEVHSNQGPWGGQAEAIALTFARYFNLYDHAFQAPASLKTGKTCLVRGVSSTVGTALVQQARDCGLDAHMGNRRRKERRLKPLGTVVMILSNTLAVFALMYALVTPAHLLYELVLLLLALGGAALALALDNVKSGRKLMPLFSRDLARHLSPAFVSNRGQQPTLNPIASPQPKRAALPLEDPPSEAAKALKKQWTILWGNTQTLPCPAPLKTDLQALLRGLSGRIDGALSQLKVAEAGAALHRSLGIDSDPILKAIHLEVLDLSKLMLQLGEQLRSAQALDGDGEKLLKGFTLAIANHKRAHIEVEESL